MAESNLITIADVSVYRKIDPKFNPDRFAGFVQEVQRKNFRNLVGQEFYYDMFLNISLPKYARLLTGEMYENVQFYGIKPLLSYWLLAVATREGDMFLSGYGAVQFANNTQQNFETAKEKERISVGYMNTAQIYANDLINYLNNKKSDYPFWVSDTGETGVQFLTFKI